MGLKSRVLPLNDDGMAWLTKRNMILRGPGACLVVSTDRGISCAGVVDHRVNGVSGGHRVDLIFIYAAEKNVRMFTKAHEDE